MDNNGSSNADSAPPRGPRGDGTRGGRGAPRHKRPTQPQDGDNALVDGTSGENRAPRNRRGGNKGKGRGGNNNTTEILTPEDLAARFASKPPTDTMAPGPPIEKDEGKEGSSAEDDDDAEVCFICAGPVVYEALTPCNHRSCHVCALRMRALYKDKKCSHCRTTNQYVIFTDDKEKRFEDFKENDFFNTDKNLGIKYLTAQMVADSVYFLRYNCPEPTCEVACRGWPDLHRHVKSVHHKKMCDLCSRHQKKFTHEHTLYNDKELQKHMSKGDDNPGAVDQSGFKGHPLCGFCGSRFYGDDELYTHCREKHERCFLCDRQDSRNPHYYVDYKSLEHHFRKDHFMCLDRECQEKKFVVFASEMDLKAHQLEEHGNSMSKDVRRDARVVDISSFDYRAPLVTERRAGETQREQRRNAGRGRDPNAEPIPASTAQPMRRDELAFQRQMAIHSAQSVTTRTFGGQLTTPTPAQAAAQTSARNTGASSSQRQQQAEAPASRMQNLNLADPSLTPQQQPQHQQHATVVDKATRMLGNDNLKVAQFRNALTSYRSEGITASGLIDTFFALFSDTASSALGTLVRDVADLYEDKKKAEGIRTAWNDWRAINEDYPSLPGPSGMTGNASTGWAGIANSMPANVTIAPAKTSRVLRLKSSTAQSSRAASNGTNKAATNSWSNNTISAPLLPASSRSQHIFPALPPSGSSVQATQKITTQPWVAPAAASAHSSAGPSPRPTPPPSRPISRATGGGRGGATGGEFPSLPLAPKPTTSIFGYGRGMVRRDNGSASTTNAWAQGGSQQEQQQEQEDAQNRKGNKGKKKVLVQWG